MQNLKVAGLQVALKWEDPAAGLAHIQTYFDSQLPQADVYILPEMFITGFTMHPEICAVTIDSPVCQWMEAEAKLRGVWLCGTLIIQDAGLFYNRLMVFGPDGFAGAYNKRHLFRMAGEDAHYAAGNHKLILDIKGWKVSFWICYDLRFPVWMRNTGLEYDVAVIPANWPERRAAHWRKLLPARAIENQTYVIGINRIGEDGNGIYYTGDSLIIDPLGEICVDAQDAEGWQVTELNHQLLTEYRARFPAWQDADDFNLNIL
jgi:omega-amidase